MTGIERRQFEMIVRVRNFGNTNQALFSSSPVAQQTFAAVSTAIDDLGATDMRKMSASVSARAGRKKAARQALIDVLQKACQLARNLRAEGRAMPAFDLPASKSALALLTAGRQCAVDAIPFEAEFTGHGMSPQFIAATTSAFEAAVNDQGMSRTEHVAAKAKIHDLLQAAIRGVRRLDLIVANDLGRDNVVQAQWKQLRRLEDPRGPRGAAEPETPASDGDISSPQAA
jgi:hypothetical protein